MEIKTVIYEIVGVFKKAVGG